MSLEKFITKVLNVKADGIQKMTSIEEKKWQPGVKALAQAKRIPSVPFVAVLQRFMAIIPVG